MCKVIRLALFVPTVLIESWSRWLQVCGGSHSIATVARPARVVPSETAAAVNLLPGVQTGAHAREEGAKSCKDLRMRKKTASQRNGRKGPSGTQDASPAPPGMAQSRSGWLRLAQKSRPVLFCPCDLG
jgi:hypothetical protein